MHWFVFYNGTHVQDGTDMVSVKIDFIQIFATIMSAFGAISCFLVVFSVLWSARIKLHGFNLYLVFHLIPDVCFNLFHFISRMVMFRYGMFPFPSQCIVGCFFTYNFTTMNHWINALIADEIYQMLLCSAEGKRFHPSSFRAVLCRVSIVYSLSMIASALSIINTRPLHDVRFDSKTCTPKLLDTRSIVVSYTLFNLATVTPCVYLSYISYKVYKKKLLPPSGKARFITFYFLRIALASTIITSMAVVTFYFEIVHAFLLLLSIEGSLVSLISLTKYDVKKAVIDTCFCSCGSFFFAEKEQMNTSDRRTEG